VAGVEATTERAGHAPKRTPLVQLGLCEALLTAVLLFGIVTIVLGPSARHLSLIITSLHERVALVGLAVGLLLIAIMLFPLSRISGAQSNDRLDIYCSW